MEIIVETTWSGCLGLFVVVVGLGGARRSLLQEMPARLRFLLQIAETKA